MRGLLALHAEHHEVCFGGAGDRTAGQLVAHAQAIAAALPSGPASAQVVVACQDRYQFAASLLAAWTRDFVAALPPNTQPETLRALGREPAVLAVLHDGGYDGGIHVGELERPERSSPVQGFSFAPETPALVAYTSGSTGAPTPHLKSFAQICDEPAMWIEHFDLGGRRIVAAVPTYHIYGLLFAMMAPLLGGGSVSRRTPKLPPEIHHELKSASAGVLIAVPPQLTAIAAHAGLAWPKLERVFSSAAPLPAETDRALAQRSICVTQILGSTETGGIAFRESCASPWQALPGVELEVDDEARLSVRSPWASARPEAWVLTADRVELLEAKGAFRHLGRVDAVVKVGGRRVDLGELEARLCAVPGVREARVLATEAPSLRGTELWAVVESDGVEVDALRAALAEHVDPVVMPRRFRVVPRLPRGPSGKVTRAALLSLFEGVRFPGEGSGSEVERAGGEVHE